MKIKAVFKTEKIPASYRMMFVSLIKNILEKHNEDYYKELYIYNDGKSKKGKNFTSAVYIKDFKKVNEEFLTDEVILNISSADARFVMSMYSALLKMEHYNYEGKYSLYKKDVKLINHRKVLNDYCMFKTMSPIVVKNKLGKFLDIDDSEYQACLNHIVNQTLLNYRGKGLSRDIDLIPVDMKKVVVKEKIKDFSEKTGKEHIYLNAYTGVFILKGDKCDLDDVYKLGIGFRRSQSYGMIDIV